MSRTIDADALIDNIKTFRCIDCERRKGMKNGKLKFLYEIGDVPCRACDVADMIDTIDEAPTVGEWISVKDRLPENEQYVMLWTKTGVMKYAKYLNDEPHRPWIAYDEYGSIRAWDNVVTHWMPLPEPPKEG